MSLRISIHQPNYIPWLGYFHKIACADRFVFLDDVQFPKHSYTNRVRIAQNDSARWLTQSVRQSFGQILYDVHFADDNWPAKHLDVLRSTYHGAAHFQDVWSSVLEMYENIPLENLAVANGFLIKELTRKLNLDCVFLLASDYPVGNRRADDRLIALASSIATDVIYLSGTGGAKYQDPEKFASAGVSLRYLSFKHPIYSRSAASFHPGLSILDAVFHLGWEGARALIVVQPADGNGMEETS